MKINKYSSFYSGKSGLVVPWVQGFTNDAGRISTVEAGGGDDVDRNEISTVSENEDLAETARVESIDKLISPDRNT